MNTSLYRAPIASLWSGRTDTEEPQGALRWHQQMRCIDLTDDPHGEDLQGHLALLGFASDAGVKRNKGRPGAAAGPDALRAALTNCACDDITLIDAGNVICVGEDLENAQIALAEHLAKLHAHAARPVVLGGGHEVAWASFQGLIPALTNSDKRLASLTLTHIWTFAIRNRRARRERRSDKSPRGVNKHKHPFTTWCWASTPVRTPRLYLTMLAKKMCAG
jgi:formiminoglutamase